MQKECYETKIIVEQMFIHTESLSVTEYHSMMDFTLRYLFDENFEHKVRFRRGRTL